MKCPQKVRHFGGIFMDKRIKFTLKQKVTAARSVISGRDSCLSAGLKIGAKKETVRAWVKHYEANGIWGLKVRHGSYNGAFKLGVVKHVLKNNLSLLDAAALFGVPKGSTILKWLKLYDKYGEGSLLHENRGKKKVSMAKKLNNNSKHAKKPATSQDAQLAALQAENEYLRAENALLKKLDALIQEEKATKLQNKRQKPSMD